MEDPVLAKQVLPINQIKQIGKTRYLKTDSRNLPKYIKPT